MKTEQIEKADTSKQLPMPKMYCQNWKHDTCTNVPREPHTQTVLYARDVWQRPAKLMPFKPWDGVRPHHGWVELRVHMRLGYPLIDYEGPKGYLIQDEPS